MDADLLEMSRLYRNEENTLRGIILAGGSEISWRRGWPTDDELTVRAQKLLKSGFGIHQLEIIEREKAHK